MYSDDEIESLTYEEKAVPLCLYNDKVKSKYHFEP
jgi:hypothetical protein